MQNSEILISIIYSIYRTILDPERWPLILTEMQSLVGSDACDISIYDFRSKKGEISIHSGCYQDRYLGLYEDYYASVNPWLQREELHRMADAAWFGEELISSAKLIGTEFYNGWLRPQGLQHRACVILCRENQRVLYLSLLRSRAAGEFAQHQIYPLQRLVPHMRQVLELHRLLVGSVPLTDCPLTEIVHRLGRATLILGIEHKLMAANELAKEVLARGNVLKLDKDGATAQTEQETATLRGMIDGAMRTAAGKGLEPGGKMRVTGSDGSDAEITVLPLAQEALLRQGGPAVALVVNQNIQGGVPKEKERLRWWPLVIQESREIKAGKEEDHRAGDENEAGSSGGPQAGPNEDKLRNLYGLTRAEARLAVLLAHGISLKAAADWLGIGMTTVRTHLQRIFGKTYTHHQAELVALLLAGPARLNVEYRAMSEEDEKLA